MCYVICVSDVSSLGIIQKNWNSWDCYVILLGCVALNQSSDLCFHSWVLVSKFMAGHVRRTVFTMDQNLEIEMGNPYRTVFYGNFVTTIKRF